MLCGQKSLGLPVCRHSQNRNCYFFMSLHGLPMVLFPYSNNAQGSSWFISCTGLPPDSLGSHCRAPPTSPLFLKTNYLLIFGCGRSLLLRGLFSSRDYCLVGVLRLLSLCSMGCRRAGFSTCSTWAQ